jgi:molecular chaperone Hsp33
MNSPVPPTDTVLRAMTDDGAFRVMVARTTDTVRAIVAAQQVDGFAASQLGDLVTAAVLVRETMSPPNRVQVLLRDGRDSLVVGDAWPEGRTRGLAMVKDRVLGIDLEADGQLQVERQLPRGASHRGVVEARIGIDGALASYFQHSEQVASFVGLATVIDPDDTTQVRSAAGYVVQLLPEVTEPPLAAMRTRLDSFGSLERWLRAEGDAPQSILAALLGNEPFTPLADTPVQFACHCSRARAIGAAAALGKDDLRGLIHKGETLRIHCDYCRELYEVGPADFEQILRD